MAGSTGTITIDDPTIAQLMTNFTASRLWDGEVWDSNHVLHSKGIRFYADGACRVYDDGQQATTCTYSLVSYVATLVKLRVRYANGTTYEGSLDELGGYFYMKNGPSSWPTIKYVNSLQP